MDWQEIYFYWKRKIRCTFNVDSFLFSLVIFCKKQQTNKQTNKNTTNHKKTWISTYIFTPNTIKLPFFSFKRYCYAFWNVPFIVDLRLVGAVVIWTSLYAAWMVKKLMNKKMGDLIVPVLAYYVVITSVS